MTTDDKLKSGIYSIGPNPEELLNLLWVDDGSDVVNGRWAIRWSTTEPGRAYAKEFPNNLFACKRICDVSKLRTGDYNRVIEEVRRSFGKAN
jgi:hypothetical protein